jgi:hypothetical protein
MLICPAAIFVINLMCVKVMGKFLARAVADDCVCPAFVNKHPGMDDVCIYLLILAFFLSYSSWIMDSKYFLSISVSQIQRMLS